MDMFLCILITLSLIRYSEAKESRSVHSGLIFGDVKQHMFEDISFDDEFEHWDDNEPYRVFFKPSSMLALRVKAKIVDAMAEVTIEQEFLTPSFFPDGFESSKATAAYQIPLDELAAVTEFRATIDDRVIEAVVKERNEARQEFEEAVEEGKNAYLAEQIRADIFYLGMGNLPKGKVVRVTLVYVTTIESLDENTLRFVFPTAVAPRYHPLDDSEEAILQGLSYSSAMGVDIDVEVQMGSSISSVTSGTHNISTSIDDEENSIAYVHVEDEDPQKRDFVLYIDTETNIKPQIFFEHSSKYNSTAMMLSYVPQISTDLWGTDMNSEFIFILDRSGSMYGLKMSQMKEAMSLTLERLPKGSLVNFIGFGSSFSVLFEEASRPLSNEEAKDTMVSYIDSMEADMGGTEILDPLQFVLEELPLITSYRRVVFVLTDGQVSNTDDTIEYVNNNRGSVQVFSLGIGEHVSALLVRGLARAGQGSAEFVDGDDSVAIESAVMRQIETAIVPSSTDVTVEWGESTNGGLQAPFHLPNLVSGKRFVAYYLVDDDNNHNNSSKDIEERIRGDFVKVKSWVISVDTGDGVVESKVLTEMMGGSSFIDMAPQRKIQETQDQTETYYSDAAGSGHLLHKMACRSLIRDLEEGSSKLHSISMEKATIDAEIVKLGVKYQIASSQTSFVAVDNEGWAESMDGMATNLADQIAPPPPRQQARPAYGIAHTAAGTLNSGSSSNANWMSQLSFFQSSSKQPTALTVTPSQAPSKAPSTVRRSLLTSDDILSVHLDAIHPPLTVMAVVVCTMAVATFLLLLRKSGLHDISSYYW